NGNGLADIADDLPEDEIKTLLIADERRAWDWARTNSPIWTPCMEREAARCLRSYEIMSEELAYELVREFVDEFCATDGNLGPEIGDAVIRNAVEFFLLAADREEARAWLVELIDKYLPTPKEKLS